MTNGNGHMKKNVTILHWNMGAKHWPNKLTEIGAVIAQYLPDIFIVSESNLYDTVPEEDRNVAGYKLLLPKTTELFRVSRLLVLVKEDLEYKIVEELNDNKLAAIWLKIGARGRKPMLVGAIYREHRYLLQDDPGISASDHQQFLRWSKYIEKWKQSVKHGDVTVIGDTNLDFLRWGNPAQRQVKMVDKVKEEIEILGFHQMVSGVTRVWKDQPESLLDQIWMNAPNHLVYYRNVIRAFSDHNMIVMSFKTKETVQDKHEMVSRDKEGDERGTIL